MSRLPRLRMILESEPRSGQWNMAVDEVLLESAISADAATVRWYRWCEPTISLGYFQKVTDLVDDPHLSQLPVVRRLTGGGAILHDQEWTYCIALPASQGLFGQPQELYDIVHRAVSKGLQSLGFPVAFRGKTLKRPDEPLLCFQRQDSHDVTLFGQKVLGSAQRRRRGAIMQHGSLICRASPFASQIAGLTDLSDSLIPHNLAEILACEMAEELASSCFISTLSQSEIDLTTRISQASYSDPRSHS